MGKSEVFLSLSPFISNTLVLLAALGLSVHAPALPLARTQPRTGTQIALPHSVAGNGGGERKSFASAKASALAQSRMQFAREQRGNFIETISYAKSARNFPLERSRLSSSTILIIFHCRADASGRRARSKHVR